MHFRPGKNEDAQVDMTPMIDVTFLLIIFFMIVSEISQTDLEILALPSADAAVPDEPPSADRLIVNIVRDPAAGSRAGSYRLRGRAVATPELKATLRREAQLDWNAHTRLSNRFILIRCDRDVAYRYVQDTMMLCANDPEIRIVKVQIAIKQDE